MPNTKYPIPNAMSKNPLAVESMAEFSKTADF